jgi:hypothetical protein
MQIIEAIDHRLSHIQQRCEDLLAEVERENKNIETAEADLVRLHGTFANLPEADIGVFDLVTESYTRQLADWRRRKVTRASETVSLRAESELLLKLRGRIMDKQDRGYEEAIEKIEVLCCVCGAPAAFPGGVKEPYTCSTCQR